MVRRGQGGKRKALGLVWPRARQVPTGSAFLLYKMSVGLKLAHRESTIFRTFQNTQKIHAQKTARFWLDIQICYYTDLDPPTAPEPTAPQRSNYFTAQRAGAGRQASTVGAAAGRGRETAHGAPGWLMFLWLFSR